MSAIELFWTKLGADGDSIGNFTRDPSQNSFVNIEVDAARMDAEIRRRLSTFGQVAMRDTEWRALRSLKRT